MAANHPICYRSGLYIPLEKQSLFMLAFEDMLVTAHNVVPVFGPATRGNKREVKLQYLGNKSYKPTSDDTTTDLGKVMEFLKANMDLLGTRKSKRKRKSNVSHATGTPQVITLDDESDVRTVDLTEVDQGDSEVIVLEDSIVNSGRSTRQSSKNISVVDLTDISEPPKTPNTGIEAEKIIKIVRRLRPQRNFPSGETTLSSFSPSKNSKKGKKKKQTKGMSLKRTRSNSPLKSGSLVSLSSTDSVPRKKRKLQDISNIHSVPSSSSSPSYIPLSHLSENTNKYYENIAKVVGKVAGEKKAGSAGKIISPRNNIGNNKKRKNKYLKKKLSPARVPLEASKRKLCTPQNNFRNKKNLKFNGKFGNRPVLKVVKSPGRPTRQSLKAIRAARKFGETNSFNPNPLEVDLEGLRPVVIDGCNVAISHGKGQFSPKGLKICVDYFAARGHKQIKIFLPQFREAEFSSDLLETLRTKCDVVFTPSQCINGQRRTPYDDRFIVQYATEFGGVIVSTDNYRDISRENPRWQDTIAKRLLMFTWVDDFLMFPVDPLGRSGPTLEEFLRF